MMGLDQIPQVCFEEELEEKWKGSATLVFWERVPGIERTEEMEPEVSIFYKCILLGDSVG